MALSHNKNTTRYLVTKQFYNGFCSVLPKEVCEIILDIYFGRIARIRWYKSSIHDDIKERSHARLIEWILEKTSCVRNCDKKITTFLKNNKTFLKYQISNAMNWYYECNCCKRHQVHKPAMDLDELYIVTKPQAFFCRDHDNHTCHCDCRHKARWLSRTWLQIMNIEKDRPIDVLRDIHLFRRLR